MKLYMNPISPNCRKVMLLAAYINAPIELATVNVPAGETETPEYLKMNPNGLVPTLQDGDFVLWESNAILQYIAEKCEATEVWPKDLETRSLVNQWQLWEANHFGRAVMMLGFENYMKKAFFGGEPDPETVETYLDYFRTHGKVMNDRLWRNPFLVGMNPTLADFAVAGAMQFASRSGVPLAEFPNIAQWFDRIQLMEAWEKTEPKLP